MTLTKLGKRHLIYMVLLAIVAVAVVIWFFTHGSYDIRILALLALPFVVVMYFRKKVYRKLEDEVYQNLNFTELSPNDFPTDNYAWHNLTSDYKVQRVESGNYNGHTITIVEFSLSIGSGKDRHTEEYTGIELLTTSTTYSMQLYDVWNYFCPGKHNSIQLESNEFNNMFRVFVQNPTDAYYNLNPDAMADLIDLHKKLNTQINVEYTGDRVFIYTTTDYYRVAINAGISITESLNVEATKEDLATFQKAITDMIGVAETVFKLLNIKQK